MDKLSWQAKLMGLIALVLGALLLFQVFYVIPYVRTREVDNAETRQEEVARNIARELDIDLMESEDRLTKIAQLAAFRNMDLASQNRIMNTIIETSSRFSSLLVLDTEGWFVAGTAEDLSIYQTKSYAYQPYFSVPFEQGEVYCALPRFISRIGVITSVSVPIESETGERVGVLRGGMILNDLMENVAHYPLEAGTVAYLVDTEGTVVAHSGMDLFALEEGPLSLDYSGRPLVQAIVAGETSGSLKHDHDGTPYFGSYVTLESNGWGVVVEAPMSSILAASEALAERLLAVNVALFVIALTVSWVFTRQIMAEQRRAEEALRMREQAITTSITPFAVGDLEGKLTYVNPAFLRLWGYDEEVEVLGKSATDFWLREEDAAEVIAALQKEDSWRGEMVARRKDGSSFTADVSASAVVDATGAPIYLASSFIDTTERVRAEAELRESQERFALFMHYLPAAVYLKDAEGRILFLNEYFEKLFQRSADECLGKTDFDLFPADVAQQFREADQQVLAEGKSVQTTEQVPQEDGLHTYIAYKFPLLREGAPPLLGGISLDITALVRAEEKLKQTVAELERTNTELERFNRLAVGRELRMIELKRQVNELAEQLGKEPPYDLSLLE